MFCILNFLICRSVIKGDHISLKNKGNLPFLHGIVVEPVHNEKDQVTVIYHSGSKLSARVACIEVDLYEQASKGELFRHRYESIICYPGQ